MTADAANSSHRKPIPLPIIVCGAFICIAVLAAVMINVFKRPEKPIPAPPVALAPSPPQEQAVTPKPRPAEVQSVTPKPAPPPPIKEDEGELEPEVKERLQHQPLQKSDITVSVRQVDREAAEDVPWEGLIVKRIEPAQRGAYYVWSPDGRYLYASDRAIELMEYPTFKQTLEADIRGSVSFCSRGLCVRVQSPPSVQILNPFTLERSFGWTLPKSYRYMVTSPGSRYAIAWQDEGCQSIQVLNLSRGTQTDEFATLEHSNVDLSIYRGNLRKDNVHLTFSPNGDYLFAVGGSLYRFRMQGDVPVHDTVTAYGMLTTRGGALSFSGNGEYVAGATYEKTVRGLGKSGDQSIALFDANDPELPAIIADLRQGQPGVNSCGVDGAGYIYAWTGYELFVFNPSGERLQKVLLKALKVHLANIVPHPTQAGILLVPRQSGSDVHWIAPAGTVPSLPTQRWLPQRARM